MSRLPHAIRSSASSPSAVLPGPNPADSPPSYCSFTCASYTLRSFLLSRTRQKLCMAAREGKMVNKIQPLFAYPVSYNVIGVRSAKWAEVLCGDNDALDPACLHFTAPEPLPFDPGLNLHR